ncbi:hypothetical protein [Vibrio sp. LaRot3]|uniref:hypothetical protein n=1 Tax=Vibrio sp. LaRot3 TaxID=2998829 RepID=UPI0022CE14E8|nr:hypothetical protein [Vibrio sp. LaRot3]MDA0149067.1 hypothetical protein [Vibrio sp. LaRot3]
MSSVLLSILLLTNPVEPAPNNALPLKCTLLDTPDQFLFYFEQMVYRSEQFVIFQNFKGRVVTQVDLKTGELIRTTYLGEDYLPNYQILLGKCRDAAHVIDLWTLGQHTLAH